MSAAILSLPVLTADAFDDFVPFELFLPAELLRRAESLIDDQDENLGDWIAGLVSAALEGQVAV